jgi:glycosyltransferase involved in cell wall biosynthesis
MAASLLLTYGGTHLDCVRMISVIIPTLNAEHSLHRCFAALIPAVIDGLVREVIVIDGGSTDSTGRIAEEAGASFLSGPPTRGGQMAYGAALAKQEFLLFLHPDCVLEADFERAVLRFLTSSSAHHRAAYFRLTLDDYAPIARRLEWLVQLRCRVLALPFGNQGLLISRKLYDAVGGYRDLAAMEDVDMVRRLGGRRLAGLTASVLTTPHEHMKNGYVRQSLNDLSRFMRYYLGLKPKALMASDVHSNAA